MTGFGKKLRRRFGLAATGALAVFLASCHVACSVFGVRTAQEHPSTDLVTDGRFALRRYEPAIVASTTVRADASNPGNVMFSRLGGYIGGENAAGQDIEMTAPVVQERTGQRIEMTVPVVQSPSSEGWVYSFVMPAEYEMKWLPQPTNPKVALERWPARLVAVYRFSGIADEGDLDAHSPALTDWLRKQGYHPVGSPRLAYYDPPWTLPFLRRNEVQIEVEPSPAE